MGRGGIKVKRPLEQWWREVDTGGGCGEGLSYIRNPIIKNFVKHGS